MFNATELLGQILQSGISNSTRQRLEHAMGLEGLGRPDGPLGELLGDGAGRPGAAPTGLAETAGEFAGADAAASGDDRGGLPRALGNGAAALLGGLALSALGRPPSAVAQPRQVAAAGGRRSQDPTEAEQSATLILAAMINAAKADGQVDQEELQRIVGKLREVGADDEALDFLLCELRKPMDLEGLIRRVPSEDLGVQLYAASLLAIELDTEAERQYLRRLAHGLGLEASVVRRVHQCMGVGHA